MRAHPAAQNHDICRDGGGGKVGKGVNTCSANMIWDWMVGGWLHYNKFVMCILESNFSIAVHMIPNGMFVTTVCTCTCIVCSCKW